MFPVTSMPLPLLPLVVVGLSQNKLCSLHSKEPMTEQPTVPDPSLLVCHPNIERDEKNPGLHCCTFVLFFTIAHTFRAKGHSHNRWAQVSLFCLHNSLLGSICIFLQKRLSLVGRMLEQALHKKSFNFRRYFQSPNLIPPFSILLCLWMFSFHLLF